MNGISTGPAATFSWASVGAHPSGMFNIYLDYDDLDPIQAPLSAHETQTAAIDDLDRIAEQTRVQLWANDEGHSRFLLRLCIYDTLTGLVVGQSSDSL